MSFEEVKAVLASYQAETLSLPLPLPLPRVLQPAEEMSYSSSSPPYAYESIDRVPKPPSIYDRLRANRVPLLFAAAFLSSLLLMFVLGPRPANCLPAPYIYATTHDRPHNIIKFSRNGCLLETDVLQVGSVRASASALRHSELRTMAVGPYKGKEVLYVVNAREGDDSVQLYGQCNSATARRDLVRIAISRDRDAEAVRDGKNLNLDDDFDPSRASAVGQPSDAKALKQQKHLRPSYTYNDEDANVNTIYAGLQHPYGLTFDVDGNMYVSCQHTDVVLRYERDTFDSMPPLPKPPKEALKHALMKPSKEDAKKPPRYSGIFVDFGLLSGQYKHKVTKEGIRAIQWVGVQEQELWMAHEDLNGIAVADRHGIVHTVIKVHNPISLLFDDSIDCDAKLFDPAKVKKKKDKGKSKGKGKHGDKGRRKTLLSGSFGGFGSSVHNNGHPGSDGNDDDSSDDDSVTVDGNGNGDDDDDDAAPLPVALVSARNYTAGYPEVEGSSAASSRRRKGVVFVGSKHLGQAHIYAISASTYKVLQHYSHPLAGHPSGMVTHRSAEVVESDRVRVVVEDEGKKKHRGHSHSQGGSKSEGHVGDSSVIYDATGRIKAPPVNHMATLGGNNVLYVADQQWRTIAVYDVYRGKFLHTIASHLPVVEHLLLSEC